MQICNISTIRSPPFLVGIRHIDNPSPGNWTGHNLYKIWFNVFAFNNTVTMVS
ncbi:hypothetical protein KP13_32080 (plasmid) [Klebsiella pneumoniae subsp. pneumoniae Kp13]|nr:hypothetical protein KP13_32080 [Klebsiella pneumoniae subsp. pneumoniae Kp13]